MEEPIGNFFLTLTKREFLDGVLKRQMLGYPVSTVEDIYHDPQLAARCFWQDVEDPNTRTSLKYPGGFAIVNGSRLAIRRPAPTVGEHNEEIFQGELGWTASEMADAEASGVI